MRLQENVTALLGKRAAKIAAGCGAFGLAAAVLTGFVDWSVAAVPALLAGAIASLRSRDAARAEVMALETRLAESDAAVCALHEKIGAEARRIGGAKQRLAAALDESSAEAIREHEAVAAALAALENVADSSRGLDERVADLGRHANETAASVGALDGSIWQIAEHTDELRHTMGEAASAASQLSAAVGQIALGAERLGESSNATNERLGRLETSVRSVESNAAATHKVSEEALDQAREGIERVTKLAHGMREIDDSFRGVQKTIDRLAERSASIDGIVGLIDEVVSRTHLLALNASIIAAQAGERGRSFSVVAREVRDLANLTADSTQEIAGHVAGVRDQVSIAVEAVEVGAARVAAGRALSDAAGESLQQIHSGSEQATAMTHEIASATEEQSAELAAVKSAMDAVATLVHQIREATREQDASSRLVLGKLDQMRELAQGVAETCSKQARDSRQITSAAAALADGIRGIQRDSGERARRDHEVRAGLRAIQILTGGHEREHLHARVAELIDQVEALPSEEPPTE